jgi:hypothetical protein
VRVRVVVVDRPRVARQRIHRRDNRRCDAGAAEHEPAAEALVGEAVVDRDTGVRIGDRGDVRDRALRASRAVRRLSGQGRVPGRAAAAGTAPRRLRPASGRAGVPERGTPDGRNVVRRRRELDSVAAVTRAGRDRDARVVVVRRRTVGEVRTAVAVADLGRAEARGLIDRLAQVRGPWPTWPPPAGCGTADRSPRPCRGRVRSPRPSHHSSAGTLSCRSG